MRLDDYSLAFIPARAGSKRIPGKNKVLLNGKSLIEYTIEAAIESGVFYEICVSTDDDDITKIAGAYKNITIDERPEKLAGDKVQCGEVILYILEKMNRNNKKVVHICMLQPTSPFRRGSHIKKAWDLYLHNNADSVVSISEYSFPPQFNVSMGKDSKIRANWRGVSGTNEVEKLYHPNGAIILLNVERYLKEKTYYMNNTYGYLMDWKSSLDIDEKKDLELANILIKESLG